MVAKRIIKPGDIGGVRDLCALQGGEPPFSFQESLGLPSPDVSAATAAPSLSSFFTPAAPRMP